MLGFTFTWPPPVLIQRPLLIVSCTLRGVTTPMRLARRLLRLIPVPRDELEDLRQRLARLSSSTSRPFTDQPGTSATAHHVSFSSPSSSWIIDSGASDHNMTGKATN